MLPGNLFLASFLLCLLDLQAQFHFLCGAKDMTLWVLPSIAQRGAGSSAEASRLLRPARNPVSGALAAPADAAALPMLQPRPARSHH